MLDGNSCGSKFLKETKKRFNSFPYPFFTFDFKEIPTMQGSVYIMSFHFKIMRPMFISLFLIIAALFFEKLFLLYIAAGIFALEFFMSPVFIYLVFKMGLKRSGYKGKIKFLSILKTLEVICQK